MSDIVINNCGCCGYGCSEGGCPCINSSGRLTGFFKGYQCVNGPSFMSSFTHTFVEEGEGILTHNSICKHAIPPYTPCTGHVYKEIMVSFDDFQVGYQGCTVSGGTYILKNYAGQGTAFHDNWPYLGGLGILHEPFYGGVGGSPCQSDTTSVAQVNYPIEYGPGCVFQYGGADYNFYDWTDNGKIKRCSTYSSPCSECVINYITGLFTVVVIPSIYSRFTITLSLIGTPTLSLTIGNVIVPQFKFFESAQDYITCWTASATYISNDYINCTGSTIFTKSSSRFGNFPESIEIEPIELL